MVLCRVFLLDGKEYQCDLEVCIRDDLTLLDVKVSQGSHRVFDGFQGILELS